MVDCYLGSCAKIVSILLPFCPSQRVTFSSKGLSGIGRYGFKGTFNDICPREQSPQGKGISEWLVSSLTELDSSKQDNMLLFVCAETAESNQPSKIGDQPYSDTSAFGEC